MYKSWMWKQRSFREQFHGDETGGGAGGTADVAATDGEASEQIEGGKPEGGVEGEATDPVNQPSDELVITLDGEEPVEEEQNRAPEWVRELRKADREKSKRIRELEQQLATASVPQKVELGAKPTLEGCDFDAERFEADLTAWHERKRQVEQKVEGERRAAEEAQAAWNKRLTLYNDAKAKLPVSDFEDAEASVQGALDTTKQAIILTGAEKPEQLIYAIGKSPAKLQELAAIKDPVQFAFAVARLETKLKVTSRKAPPPAEKRIAGSGGTSGAAADQLERLQAEADKTGDRTKVAEYLRKRRLAAA